MIAIPTGGGSLVLAGMGITAASAAVAANVVVGTGVAVTGASIVYAATNNGNSKGYNTQKARSNSEANKWANKFGYKSAEILKEEFVGRGSISKFNMLINEDTGEIILEGIKTGVKVFTRLFLK